MTTRNKEPCKGHCDRAQDPRSGFMSPPSWSWGAEMRWVLVLLVLVPAGVPAEPSLPIPLQTRTLFTEWGSSAGSSRGLQPVCLDIPSNMSLCYGVGYRQMRLPNLLEHDTMAEVWQQAASWVPLVNIRCHGDAQLFLCSLFSPVCLDRPIYPCRSLCEAVRRGCEGRMRAHGYPWPDMFRCDKFPQDNDMCIASQSDPDAVRPPRPDSSEEHVVENANDECRPCKQVDTYENVLDNLCRADFAVRAKLRGRSGRNGRGAAGATAPSDGDLRTARVLKASGPVVRKMVRDALPALPPSSSCPACAQEPQPGAFGSHLRGRDSYLVMGSVGPDKELEITFVLPWTTKSRAIKKAVRTFTNTNCSNPNLVSRTVIVDTYTPVEGSQMGPMDSFGGVEGHQPRMHFDHFPAPTTASTTTSTTTPEPTTTTTTTTTAAPTTMKTTTAEYPYPSPPARSGRPTGRNRANGARNRQNSFRSRRPDKYNEVRGNQPSGPGHVVVTTTPLPGSESHIHRHHRPGFATDASWHNRHLSRSTTTSTTTPSTTMVSSTTPSTTTTRSTTPSTTTFSSTPSTTTSSWTTPSTTTFSSTTPSTTTVSSTSPPTTTPSTTTFSSTTSSTTTPSTTTFSSTTSSTTPSTTTFSSTTYSTTTPSTTTFSSTASSATTPSTTTVSSTTRSSTKSITAIPDSTTSTTMLNEVMRPNWEKSSQRLSTPTHQSPSWRSKWMEHHTTTPRTTWTGTTTRTDDVRSYWKTPSQQFFNHPSWRNMSREQFTTDETTSTKTWLTSTIQPPTTPHWSHVTAKRWYPSLLETASPAVPPEEYAPSFSSPYWTHQKTSTTDRSTSVASWHQPGAESFSSSSTSSHWEDMPVIQKSMNAEAPNKDIFGRTDPLRKDLSVPTWSEQSTSTTSTSTRQPSSTEWWSPPSTTTSSSQTYRQTHPRHSFSVRSRTTSTTTETPYPLSPASPPLRKHKQRRLKNRRRKQHQQNREGKIPLPKTLDNF